MYIFTSPSGTVYVGQTINFRNRLRQHKNPCLKDSRTPFHRAIKKYGVENFAVEQVECEEHELDLFERLLIGIFKGICKIYNIIEGGGSSRGYKHSSETIEKMRTACFPRTNKQLAAIRKNLKKGRHHGNVANFKKGWELAKTPEHQAKLRQSVIDYWKRKKNGGAVLLPSNESSMSASLSF